MADLFHVRFNIDVPTGEAHRRFINRIENRVLNLAKVFYDAGKSTSMNAIDPLIIDVEFALGESHLRYVSSPVVFVEVWKNRINDDFLRCLIATEKLYQVVFETFGEIGQRKVNAAITETLAQCEVDLGIFWDNGYFLKKGVKILDENLVNEPLRWLADAKYENVFVPFRKGLSHLLEGTKDPHRFGDAVTDMYEAVEAMAKLITAKPGKDLSALREEFIAKLRLSEVHKEMLKVYIDYGCDFRHALETGQKRTWPLEYEAENFVYLTGLFIRLAIQSEKL